MKLVLDNNSLFSIMNPHSVSAYIFASIKCAFIAPEFAKMELTKYKEECLFKSKLSEQEFEIRQEEVEGSIGFVKESEYDGLLLTAIRRLPDPKDAPYLATALLVNAPIWSNDPHLKEQSLVKVFSTKELIEKLLCGEL